MLVKCSVRNSSVKASTIRISGRKISPGHARSGSGHDARRLMRRVPPVDREFDDRDIDAAHQRHDGDDARCLKLILERHATAR